MRVPSHGGLRGLVAAVALITAAGCGILVTDPVPYGTIRVEAESRSGAPLPGLVVELYIGAFSVQYGTTDQFGRVVFSRVPVGQYGVAMRITEDLADLSEILPVAPRGFVDGLEVVPGMDTTIQFTFAKRGLGSLEARVQSQTGRLLPGILVYFYGSTGILGGHFTDSRGVARRDSVPFGQYGAFVLPPDSLGVLNQSAVFRDVLAVDLDFVPRAEITIQTCIGNITPQARDQNDNPIVGAPVALYSGDGILAGANTDANGRVSFAKLRCDNYGVFLVPGFPGYDVIFERGFGVADGLIITPDADLSPTIRATRLP